jgi:hypothetical protein
MKRILFAAALAIASIGAFAGTPTTVTNESGNVVYGTAQALSVEKDTSAGFNRVKVKYSSGFQFVADDASWARYAKIVVSFGMPVAATPTLIYDTTKSNGISCQGGQSTIAWPNVGMAESLNDGCAFFNAAKGSSN